MREWRPMWRLQKWGSAFVVLLLLVAMAERGSAGSKVRGISPADLKYFEGDTIWCRDGSRSFLRERLNDNFCDCADGTDEPGTSACPDSKFYCRNIGSTPKVVYASRVNDGICDCCDGSDEYEKLVKCGNTCEKTGNQPREKKGMKLGAFQEYPSKIKSYFDRGALLHEQQNTFFFEKTKMLGLVSKVKGKLLFSLRDTYVNANEEEEWVPGSLLLTSGCTVSDGFVKSIRSYSLSLTRHEGGAGPAAARPACTLLVAMLYLESCTTPSNHKKNQSSSQLPDMTHHDVRCKFVFWQMAHGLWQTTEEGWPDLTGQEENQGQN